MLGDVVLRDAVCYAAAVEALERVGELALSLREELTDIQYGRRPDPHDWMLRPAVWP